MKWALYGLLSKWIKRSKGRLGMESFLRIFEMRLFYKRLFSCEESGTLESKEESMDASCTCILAMEKGWGIFNAFS